MPRARLRRRADACSPRTRSRSAPGPPRCAGSTTSSASSGATCGRASATSASRSGRPFTPPGTPRGSPPSGRRRRPAPDGRPFRRPGRATFVLARRGGRWLCVHSHVSLLPTQSENAHGRSSRLLERGPSTGRRTPPPLDVARNLYSRPSPTAAARPARVRIPCGPWAPHGRRRVWRYACSTMSPLGRALPLLPMSPLGRALPLLPMSPLGRALPLLHDVAAGPGATPSPRCRRWAGRYPFSTM